MTDKADDLPPFAPEFAPRWPGDIGGYTADQMRAAVAKERGRCLNEIECGIWVGKTTEEVLDSIAAAIRS